VLQLSTPCFVSAVSRFPSVAHALREGVFDQPDSADGEFAFGLDRILDGVEVLVRRRTA
jgi:hypothetical protein